VKDSILAGVIPSIEEVVSDQDLLIARCLQGEESAYRIVYNQYAGMIFRLCYSLLQNKEDAEEVLQDTFEYAFRRLKKFDSKKASFKTWLYQISISRCRNKRRRKWLVTIPMTTHFVDHAVDGTTPSPAESMELNEQQKIIWMAIGELSPKLREVSILRYYESMTYVEIGRVLSIPPKTAESRMRLAHKSLRKKLQVGTGPSTKDESHEKKY
jgi:RNA polymerase sigma-70 factor (ECF subfamily)